MAKINFTKEHLASLRELATKMLFNNILIKGTMGTELNVFELIHNTTINTLITLLGNVKKAIENMNNLDEWSMTPYQQKKLKILEENKEFLNLLIGYKKYRNEVQSDKEKLAQLKVKRAELEEQALTPEAKLKALDEEIAAMGTLDEEETE